LIYTAYFEPADAVKLFGEFSEPPALPIAQLIDTWQSPGSLACTLWKDKRPVACGGIINFNWYRGEAWILVSPDIKSLRVPLRKIMKQELARMAVEGEFRRVQATCYSEEKGQFFRKLGFEYEGYLKSFGPKQENAILYSRVFQ